QLDLVRGLSDEELERYGMHVERGKETIRHLLSLYAGHDLNHLAQIERLIAERGAAAAAPAGVTPAPTKPEITAAHLDALDVRLGTIRAAVPVAGADRLALLTVSF